MSHLLCLVVAVSATILAGAVIYFSGLDAVHMYWLGPYFSVTYLILHPKIYRYLTRP